MASITKSLQIMKLVILGDGYVGKTALLRRFKAQSFNDEYKMTVGADFVIKELNYENQRITLQIYDVGGQEKFKPLRSKYYSNAEGVIIVFDLLDRKTFESIPNWLNEVLEKNDWRLVPTILVGNKTDLIHNHPREVQKDEILAYVEQLRDWGKQLDPNFKIEYFETSAKTGKNVNKSFETITSLIG